jgi:hypothetical protein
MMIFLRCTPPSSQEAALGEVDLFVATPVSVSFLNPRLRPFIRLLVPGIE